MREIIRRLNPRLFRIARTVLADDGEAEEAVQDAYLSAFASLDTFRGEARFSTWITRIALNCARMRRRRLRTHEPYDTVDELGSGESAIIAFPGTTFEAQDEALSRSEAKGLLEAAIDGLPEPFRVALVLRESENMTVAEIARDLSLNQITVKTRLFRARRKLRAALEERLHGGFDRIFPFDGERCTQMADRVVVRLRSLG